MKQVPKRRLTIAAGAVAASVVALTGCTAGAGADSEADLVMTVWSQDEAQLAVFQGIADEFAAASPLVNSVRIDSIPWDTYTQNLTIRLSGGEAPDLGWVFVEQVQQLVEAGVLSDLSEAFADPEYDYADVLDSTKTAWQYGDETYGFQFSTAPTMVFYNADAFAASGQKTPLELFNDGEWTWDAFADAAAGIVESGALRYGFAGFSTTDLATMVELYKAYGAEPWRVADDGTVTCTADSPEMAEAMDLMLRMMYQDHSHPRIGETGDFFAGDAAMIFNKQSAANRLVDAGFTWDVVPVPSGPAGFTPQAGRAGLAVFHASKHQEAAAEFLKFWTNEQSVTALSQFYVPSRQAVLDSGALKDANPFMSEEQVERTISDVLPHVDMPTRYSADDVKLADAVNTAIEPLWTGTADTAEVLGAVCVAIDAAAGN